MDPKLANLVNFNAPNIYFPFPRSNTPPAPTVPSMDIRRLRGVFGGWEEEEKIRMVVVDVAAAAAATK